MSEEMGLDCEIDFYSGSKIRSKTYVPNRNSFD